MKLYIALAALLLTTFRLHADTSLAVPSADLRWHENGTVLITRKGQPVIDLQAIRFDHYAPLSATVTEATADALRITLTYPAAVDFRSRGTAPLTAELTISRQGDGFRFRAAPAWGSQVTLELADLGDHWFGLSSPLQPHNRHSPNLRDAVVTVDMAGSGEDIVENYASAFSPLYLSSHGYGAFFDTFGAGRYEIAINGRHRIHHQTGTLDWYLFFGDEGRAIHRAYYDVIGDPKKLPLWALGPVAWRDENTGGAAEILADVVRFDELRLPITAWMVDRPYSDGAHAWSHMNFNARFADPATWIRQLREDHGVEFLTWTATAFFGDTPLPRHLPGGFTYADLSDPATVAAYQQNLTTLQHAVGVKGHKMDRADEQFPSWEAWADTSVPVEARRNTYAYLFARIHDEALRRTWGDDQFTFARAGIHRAQPHLSALWGGDPRTSWQGLQGNAANAIRASFLGFPVWGTDVGGYLGEGYIEPDLYLRWLQFGVFNGLLEIKLDGSGGQGRDRMPWRYDEAFQAEFRQLLELRMALVPYLYSLANTSATTGPLMQPLAYRHLDDPRTYDVWDEYYVGEGLLVAPVLTAETARDVYLPTGRWHRFDFETGIRRTHTGGTSIRVDAAVEEIPLFVRANSLLVTGDIYRGNSRNWLDGEPGALTIHAFPGEIGESTSFTYVDAMDGNTAKTITLTHNADGLAVTGPGFQHPATVVVHLDSGPSTHLVPADEPVRLQLSK